MNKWIVYDVDNEYVEEFETKQDALAAVEEAMANDELTSSTRIAEILGTYKLKVNLIPDEE